MAIQLEAQHFGALDAIRLASEERLKEVPDIGEIVARHLRQFFDSTENLRTIEELQECGVTWPESDALQDSSTGVLRGHTLVVTGALAGMTRDEARELVRRAGGRVTGSVSKNTDYLVVGTNPGRKLAKARELGVEVLTEEQLISLVG